MQLGRRLLPMLAARPVILALPRGGLPVAAKIAEALDAPLDLMLVRKIGVPGHRELAVGAIAGPEGREMVINHDVAAMAGLDERAIERLAEPERAELRRRQTLYLKGRAPLALSDRTVILVDDGIATGATAKAALLAIRRAKPRRIVLAVPVAAADSLAALRSFADDIVCLDVPDAFYAVGAHYRDFPQVEDTEVLRILASCKPQAEPSQAG